MGKHFNLLFTGLLCLLAIGNLPPAAAQEGFKGAWEQVNQDEKTVLLVEDGYLTYTRYNAREFLATWGGPFHIDGKQIVVTVEFDTERPEKVRSQVAAEFDLQGDRLELAFDQAEKFWKRIDGGAAPLAGVWQITDREQGGKLVPIHRSGTRKTLKMLTGTRFQWFAIDPGTKGFSGTGGGTYTFENGKYTEHIAFFSRDNKRVGAALTFDGKLENGKWHHSGLSSKGDKIYEVWGKIKE